VSVRRLRGGASAIAATLSLFFDRTLSLTPAPVTFEPDEFVHQAAFLGGTGSGKTTAALNLIEQLISSAVPAGLLDRKGDLCRSESRFAIPLVHRCIHEHAKFDQSRSIAEHPPSCTNQVGSLIRNSTIGSTTRANPK
jgi:hypothetical protein